RFGGPPHEQRPVLGRHTQRLAYGGNRSLTSVGRVHHALLDRGVQVQSPVCGFPNHPHCGAHHAEMGRKSPTGRPVADNVNSPEPMVCYLRRGRGKCALRRMFVHVRHRILANMSATEWSEVAMAELLPTGPVALLLADVEGSPQLWESQPDAMTT